MSKSAPSTTEYNIQEVLVGNYVTNISGGNDVIYPTSAIISDGLFWYFRVINLSVLGQLMALFGIVTNIINITVFFKSGVKDPMNISLLGISISDLMSCLTVIWTNICLTPPFTELEGLPFIPLTIHALFGAWPHVIFVKITTIITAFITVERCICVTFPLKVKDIFTTKRVALSTFGIYIFVIALASPIYYVNRYDWVYIPTLNRSLYTLVFTDDRDVIEPLLVFIFGVVIAVIIFIITIVCTIVLVHNLKKNAKWRREATRSSMKTSAGGSTNQISSRDTKVAKMVVMISSLFLVCFSPIMISAFAMATVPGLNEGGVYVKLLYVILSCAFLLESTNASFNIFIYYFMSSNYKAMLHTIICKKRMEKK